MAYNNSYGSKYEATKNLNRAELKALMLADLKAAQKSGGLPKCRLSLREARGVGTRGITITIAGMTGLLNPERVRHDECEPNVFVEEFRCPRFTAEAERVKARVSSMLEAYNYDRSEIETDYFDVRFYLHVEFNAKELAAQRQAIIDAASPLRRELREEIEAAFAVMNDAKLMRGEKPDKYGPGEPSWFAKRFDAFFRKLGHPAQLSAKVEALKAKIATADDWSEPARAAA